ncbi:MAG: T9SS type A sorting domain-containing protein [Bacteroidia bacterium]|nr:T9SS type A sorting domain-containing protein [Bacteroidia bacterium]
MKKVFTLVSSLLIGSAVFAQTNVTIRIDTKLMSNTDCNLGGDGNGGGAIVPEDKVYIHSGVCSHSTDVNKTDQQFCLEQIIPYASEVWQHVVGDWGQNPQDNGKGLMTPVGNGVYELNLVLEDYYSDPNLLSQDAGANNGVVVVNTPLPSGATVYTMGMVFRSKDGQLSGRDQQGCQDIFAKDFNTDNPLVINSTDNSVSDFVTIIKSTGFSEIGNLNNFVAYPNPFSERMNLDFAFNKTEGNCQIVVTDLTGKQVALLFDGAMTQGKHQLVWTGVGADGSKLATGTYFVSMVSGGKSIKTEKVFFLNN